MLKKLRYTIFIFSFFIFSLNLLLPITRAQDIEKLIQQLNDPNPRIRWIAADALGNINDPRAVQPLIAALKDKDSGVRSSAADALGEIKDPRAIEPLIAALRDENSYVRRQAAEALGKIKDPRATEPLIAALKDEDNYVRKKAAEALGCIGNKQAIPALIPALRDWHAGKEVADALDKLGWKPESDEDKIHYLVARRKGDELKRRWEKTKEVLLNDVDSNNYRVIENALYALIGIGRKEIIRDLIDKLNEKGTKVIAEAYLNCGNRELYEAAKAWASRHGYVIFTGSGAAPVGWGSLR